MELYDVGNSPPIQIAYPNIRRVTVKKAFFEEEAKGVTRQPFPNALEESKEESIQLHMWLFETLD